MDFLKQLVSAIQGPKFHQQDVVDQKVVELREEKRKVDNLAASKRRFVAAAEKLKDSVTSLQQASEEHEQALKELPDISKLIDRTVRKSGHLLIEAHKDEDNAEES
jgi:hypothetical protein